MKRFLAFLRKVELRLGSFATRAFYTVFPPNIEVLIDELVEYIVADRTAGKRVLYIGLKYDYGDKRRGLAYEEYNFFFALKNMVGIELFRFDFNSVASRYGKAVANRIVKEVVLLEDIDTLFCLLYKDYYDHEIILDLSRNYPVDTIIWLFDDDKRFSETRALVRCFNKVVTTIRIRHESRCEEGLNSYLAQFSANHYVYRDYGLEKQYDVVFVGQNFGNRSMYVDYLKANGIDVKAYGRGWSEGRLSQSEMIELFNRARIILNFSSSQGHPELKFLKGRVFEIPASGGFLLTEACDELEDYFDVGVEVEQFAGRDELLDKVRYYLEQDEKRREIAAAGKEKVLKYYTIERYLREVIDLDQVNRCWER